MKIFVDKGAGGYEHGSGFFVSPNVICTAGHVGYSQGKKVAVFDYHVPSMAHATVMNIQRTDVSELGKGLFLKLWQYTCSFFFLETGLQIILQTTLKQWVALLLLILILLMLKVTIDQ